MVDVNGVLLIVGTKAQGEFSLGPTTRGLRFPAFTDTTAASPALYLIICVDNDSGARESYFFCIHVVNSAIKMTSRLLDP